MSVFLFCPRLALKFDMLGNEEEDEDVWFIRLDQPNAVAKILA